MFSLRQTWTSTFTENTLLELDTKVKDIDAAWPVTAKFALDNLRSQKRCLEQKLAATKLYMEQLNKQTQDETTSLEKDPTALTYPNESDAQPEPDSKKIKLDWMELKVECNLFENQVDDEVTNDNDDGAAHVEDSNDNDDDDDDVIEVVKESTIIEIADDDDDDDKIYSTVSTNDITKHNTIAGDKSTSPTVISHSSNVLDLHGHWINNSTIDVKKLIENSVKIKVEPKDEENSDDDDDCFEDIGEIFYDNGELLC